MTWSEQAAVRQLARMAYKTKWRKNCVDVFTDADHDVEPERFVGTWQSLRQALADLETLRWPVTVDAAMKQAQLQLFAHTDELEEWRKHWPADPIPDRLKERIVDAARRYLRTVTVTP